MCKFWYLNQQLQTLQQLRILELLVFYKTKSVRKNKLQVYYKPEVDGLYESNSINEFI